MNNLKSLTVLVIAAAFSFAASQVLAYTQNDAVQGSRDHQAMPAYNQPFQSAQEAVRLPEDQLICEDGSRPQTQSIDNFDLDDLIEALKSLQYGVTSDSLYTDLGGIKQRQAEIFQGASDCLDRAVYLFNAARDAGLDPSIYILYNPLTRQGHAIVGMDLGDGEKFFDPVSGEEYDSLEFYTGQGMAVAAEAGSLEDLTVAVKNINGAYDIAWEGSGTESDPYSSSDDAYGDMCAEISGFGGSSDWGSSGSDGSSGFNSLAASAGDFFSAMNSGNWGAMANAFSNMAGSFSNIASYYDGSSSNAGARDYSAELAYYKAGNYDFPGAAPAVSFTGFSAMYNSAQSLGRDLASGNYADLARDLVALNNACSSLSSGNSPASNSYRTGEQTARITPTGINPQTAREGQVLATETRFVDGRATTDTRTFISNGRGGYNEYDTKGMLVGSGNNINKDVARNIVNSLYDPGHQIVTGSNGDIMNVDLSDGSYTIRGQYNQQIGSGSKNAIDTYHYDKLTRTGYFGIQPSSLQVLAVNYAAGHDVTPQSMRSLLYALHQADPQSGVTQWTYTSSKGNADYFQNVYTGRTIQLASERGKHSVLYSLRDSEGKILSQWLEE